MSKSAPKRNRSQQKEDTRNTLKRSAQSCFEARGYLETSIADITREAGVALGTFYVHFKDKEALLDELLHEFNSELVIRLVNALSKKPASLEAAVAIAVDVFLTHWKQSEQFVVAYAQKAAAGVAVTNLRDGINPETADFLSQRLTLLFGGTGKAAIRGELIAHALLALWLRLGMQYLFNKRVNRKDVAEVLCEATVSLIKPFVKADAF